MSATAARRPRPPPPPPGPARHPRRRLENPLRRPDRRGPRDRRPPGPGRLRPRSRPGLARLLPVPPDIPLPVIEVDGDLLGATPATARPGLPSRPRPLRRSSGAPSPTSARTPPTPWPARPRPSAPHWCQAARQLEESRIEGRQVTRRPGDRRWLRATVTQLILDDFTAAGAAPSTPREAGAAAALLLARSDAGILDPAETALVDGQGRGRHRPRARWSACAPPGASS